MRKNLEYLTILCEPDVEMIFDKTLPDPALLDYYNRLSNRELFINSDIDDYCIDYAKQIFDWNKADKDIPLEKRKTIKIYINTDGGETTSMNTLVAAIQLSKTKCITIGMGKCFSAGSMLLIAPKPENRYILPNTIVMMHKGSSGIGGDVNKIIDYSKFLEKENENCKQYILANTDITEREYKKIENKDWFLFKDDIVKYGICKNVITDLDEII